MHLKRTSGSLISTLVFEEKLGSGRVSINIQWKIYQGRQSSCSIGIPIKGVAIVINWLKCLGGIMHLKPTAGCQISTLVFEEKLWSGRVSINIQWKIYQERESSCSIGIPIKSVAIVINWLKCLGGIMYLKPTAGCQISTLIFEDKLWSEGLYKYLMKNKSRTAKFLPTWNFS